LGTSAAQQKIDRHSEEVKNHHLIKPMMDGMDMAPQHETHESKTN
jgi:hypothetical protein